MAKRKKGGDKMTTVTLKDLEKKVLKNNELYKDTVARFSKETEKSNMKKGRVRPKDPTEAKILSMFNKRK